MAKDQKSYFLSSDGYLRSREYIKKTWEFLQQEEQRRRENISIIFQAILLCGVIMSLFITITMNNFESFIFLILFGTTLIIKSIKDCF